MRNGRIDVYIWWYILIKVGVLGKTKEGVYYTLASFISGIYKYKYIYIYIYIIININIKTETQVGTGSRR